MANTVRTRFAPSPTGYMHVGNLRTALYAYLMAKHSGGKFILRIEDTDQERYVEGAVDIIYNTLRETGLLWDEGPDIGGPVGPYIQSERMGMFKAYAEQLVKEGKAYYCFCDKQRLDEMRPCAKGQRPGPALRRPLPQPDARADQREARRRRALRHPPEDATEGTTSFEDVVYGHIEVDNSTLDDQIPHQDRRHAHLQFRQRRGRPSDGHHARDRGSEYLSSTPKYNLLYQDFAGRSPPTSTARP